MDHLGFKIPLYPTATAHSGVNHYENKAKYKVELSNTYKRLAFCWCFIPMSAITFHTTCRVTNFLVSVMTDSLLNFIFCRILAWFSPPCAAVNWGGLWSAADSQVPSLCHMRSPLSEELPTSVHWDTLPLLRHHCRESRPGLCRVRWQRYSCTLPHLFD